MQNNIGFRSGISSKQKGFTLIELMIVLIVIAILGIGVAMAKPVIVFMQQKSQVNDAVDVIVSDSLAFKGIRPSYPANLSISELCKDGYLNTLICGAAKNGVGSNPFAGDWKVVPSTQYGAGHISIELTNIPFGRFQELADNLAARSKAGCVRADASCPSVVLTPPAANAAGGVVKIDI